MAGWTGLVVAVLGILVAAAALMDEPLRMYIERNANASQLEGYHLRIGKLDVHPLTLSLDLEDVALIQTAQPDPAMIVIPT